MAFVGLFLFLFTLVSMAEDQNFNCPLHLTNIPPNAIQTNSSQLIFERASYLLHLAEQNQFTNLPLTLSFTQHAIQMLAATSQSTTTSNLTNADHADLLEQLTETANHAQSIFQEAIERALRPFDADQDSLDRISTDIHAFLSSGNISLARRLAKRGYKMWTLALTSFILEYQSAFVKWLLDGCRLLRHCTLLALDDAARQIGQRFLTTWQHHESLFSIVFSSKKYNKRLSEAMKHYNIVLLKQNSNAVVDETRMKLIGMILKLSAGSTSTESMYNWATKMYRGVWKTVAGTTGTNANNGATSTNKTTSLKECRRKICQEMDSECDSEGLPFQAKKNNNNNNNNSNNNNNNNNSECHSSIGVLETTGLKADQIVDILLREYIAEGRPVLLKNAAASLGLPSLTSLTMEQLLLRFGGSKVSTTKASVVAIQQAELHEYPMTMSAQSTLVDFHSTFMTDETKDTVSDCDPPYVFGTLDDGSIDLLFDRRNKEQNGFNASNLLGKWTSALHETGRFRTETRHSALFYVGGALSGTYFHSHPNALNVLINGSKRWWLVPPNVLFGPDSVSSMVDWYTKYKSTLPFTPLECTQRSGDIFFVPTEWHHATMNLENVFGWAVEIGKDTASISISSSIGTGV